MKGGYESLVWLEDEDGKEYVCSVRDDNKEYAWEDLDREEKDRCMDVSLLIGTERW